MPERATPGDRRSEKSAEAVVAGDREGPNEKESWRPSGSEGQGRR